ncbi:MAG: dehydrogenase/reductase SDR family protein 7B [Bacteroidia bacterium]|jgi:dehydrogenase/reductase SDR family protein 7B
MKKTVWITGASSGIGEALTYEYAQLGWQVIISARRESVLEEVKSNCENAENIQLLPLDLAEHGLMKQKVAEALKLFGQIDVLVNNGGISQRSLALETSLEVDKRLMDVNYFGTVALIKGILPHFIERKSGQITTITSLVGKFGTPYRSSYSASKHALHGFIDAVRAEHFKDNVKFTIACPGFVQTNVSKNALTADGSPQNTMDEATANGITAQKCAKSIIKAIQQEKEEVYIGQKEIYAVYLKRFFPSFFSRFLRKASVK